MPSANPSASPSASPSISPSDSPSSSPTVSPSASPSFSPTPATCTDHLLNGDETSVDCGGGECPPCRAGEKCEVGKGARDCTSGMCKQVDGTCDTLTPTTSPSQSPTASIVDWRAKGAVCPTPNLGLHAAVEWAARSAVAARCFLTKTTPTLVCDNVTSPIGHWKPPCKIAGFTPLYPIDEKVMLAVLVKEGPLVVHIQAEQPCIELYQGGIIDRNYCSCDANKMDHEMLLVGAGTDPHSGEDYWVLQNDWGPEWGEGGTVRIARNQEDTCGVALDAAFPRCPCSKL